MCENSRDVEEISASESENRECSHRTPAEVRWPYGASKNGFNCRCGMEVCRVSAGLGVIAIRAQFNTKMTVQKIAFRSFKMEVNL
ncbi:hypothetical protein AVEN_36707-1 [Araneus ventricosus]|uniref:Uncharacterized protein n=1 Tax=Araneus ventricosus TaxID=182803 RepID=A0A4Y2VNV3_ARAVE|nr:hypothetical protein AVEN_36707-1 [Araneus ventricosus]